MVENCIYIVPTPIGNLDDITLRAISVLRNVDLIAAEDTRHSKKLMQHLDVTAPMISLHEHNEASRVERLLAEIEAGKSIALISDAGTPLISDPGFVLVKALQDKGVKVVPLPGACAAITALSAAGLPSDRFLFVGFLPSKKSQVEKALEKLKTETATMIFYESPRRILSLLTSIQTVLGEREVVIARELTKLFETIKRDTVSELIKFVEADENQQRGEFVVMVRGAEKSADTMAEIDIEKILKLLLKEMSVSKAAKLASEITGVAKNRVYEMALRLTGSD